MRAEPRGSRGDGPRPQASEPQAEWRPGSQHRGGAGAAGATVRVQPGGGAAEFQDASSERSGVRRESSVGATPALRHRRGRTSGFQGAPQGRGRSPTSATCEAGRWRAVEDACPPAQRSPGHLAMAVRPAERPQAGRRRALERSACVAGTSCEGKGGKERSDPARAAHCKRRRRRAVGEVVRLHRIGRDMPAPQQDLMWRED